MAKRQSAKGLGTGVLNLAPNSTFRQDGETEERQPHFKLTLYLPKVTVDDFDEAWSRIKRGSPTYISRSNAYQAAIQVALEHQDEIAEKLGIGQ